MHEEACCCVPTNGTPTSGARILLEGCANYVRHFWGIHCPVLGGGLRAGWFAGKKTSQTSISVKLLWHT